MPDRSGRPLAVRGISCASAVAPAASTRANASAAPAVVSCRIDLRIQASLLWVQTPSPPVRASVVRAGTIACGEFPAQRRVRQHHFCTTDSYRGSGFRRRSPNSSSSTNSTHLKSISRAPGSMRRYSGMLMVQGPVKTFGSSIVASYRMWSGPIRV